MSTVPPASVQDFAKKIPFAVIPFVVIGLLLFIIMIVGSCNALFKVTPDTIKGFIASKDIASLKSVIQEGWGDTEHSQLYKLAIGGVAELDPTGEEICKAINSFKTPDGNYLSIVLGKCKEVSRKISAWRQIELTRFWELEYSRDLGKSFLECLPPEDAADIGCLWAFYSMMGGRDDLAEFYLGVAEKVASGTASTNVAQVKGLFDIQKNYKSKQKEIAESKAKQAELMREKLNPDSEGEDIQYFNLHAFMICQYEDKQYEIRLDDGQRAVLVTIRTEFSSPGNFFLNVRYVGETNVKLVENRGGFKQKWKLFEEVTQDTIEAIDRAKKKKAEMTEEISRISSRVASLKESSSALFKDNQEKYLDGYKTVEAIRIKILQSCPNASGSGLLNPFSDHEVRDYIKVGNPFCLAVLLKIDPSLFKARPPDDANWSPYEFAVVDGGSIEALRLAKENGADFLQKWRDLSPVTTAESHKQWDIVEEIKGQ